MKKCPSCGRKYSKDILFCPLDGKKLRSTKEKSNLSAGQLFVEKFEIGRSIDLDGKWSVYEGTEIKTERPVVIRIKNISFENDYSFVKFQDRLKSLSEVSYPGLVKILDFGVTPDKLPFVVTEYIKGNSLKRIIRDTSLSLSLYFSIMKQVLETLNVAHRHEIIHFDLQPSKIILIQSEDRSEKFVKIVGFGEVDYRVGRNSLATPSSLKSVETHNYTAPEIFSEETIDHRCDFYSAGIIFYEMSTGILPFPVGSLLSPSQTNPQPPPMRRVNPALRIPKKLEKAIFKAIQWDPKQRHANAHSFLREIKLAERSFPLRKIFLVSLFLGIFLLFATENFRAWCYNSYEQVRTIFFSKDNDSSQNEIEPEDLMAAITESPEELFEKQREDIIPLIVKEESSQDVFEEMLYIPPFQFTLGTEEGDSDEKPVRTIEIDGFYIDLTEVTNEKYQKFLETTSHNPPSQWKKSKFSKGQEKYPVVGVSWFDASLFAYWKGKRLPSEVEWEAATRFVYKTKFSKLNMSEGLANANFKRKYGNFDYPSLLPSGQFFYQRSGKKISDLIGNAWEWTDSWYDSNLKEDRVIRGGSFRSDFYRTRLTYRDGFLPSSFRDDIGFRCVKDLPGK